MKTQINLFFITVLSICLLFTTTTVLSLDEENCTSKVFRHFQLVEKTGHNKAYARPKGETLKRTRDLSINCPWQLEDDFNGDKVKDWIGVAEKDGKYSLIAYLSGKPKYIVKELKQYSKFPSKVYLNQIYSDEIVITKKQATNTKTVYAALIINEIEKNSTTYLWNGTKFVVISESKEAVVYEEAYNQMIQ